MPTWVDKILNSQSVQLGLAAVAFLIALLLVIVIARMLMGGRLRLPGSRARQARLGIVDAFDLDRQRQLIIVRRDNTEHLIMIGGPNDLVIESEIVRVEARDFRDNRREKGFEGTTEARIPARIGAPNGEGQAAEAVPTRVDEPPLPLDLPPSPLPPSSPPQSAPPPIPQPSSSVIDIPTVDAPRDAPSMEPPGPRGPTFPLPPRRPAPLERRVPPVLPDRVSRTEDRTPPSVRPPGVVEDAPQPDASSATQTTPMSPPVSPAAAPVAPSPSPLLPASLQTALTSDAPIRPPPLQRPSVLKPLPPRPPIRPLKRTLLGDASTTPAATREEPAPPALPTAPVTPSAPLSPPQPPVAAQSPVPAPPTAAVEPPAPAPPEADALESLEEEMAKLLGRG